MKITIYTSTDCLFSKQEKEYLTSNNLPYEEKNLETNKQYLTEMLTLSNNFAGTPVTKIEKDDGTTTVLKGFTKEDFDKELKLAPAEPSTPTPPTPVPPTPTSTPTPQPEPTPPPPVEPPTPPTPPAPPTEPPSPPTPPPTESPTPTTPTAAPNDALNSILEDLQKKSSEPTPTPSVPNFP